MKWSHDVIHFQKSLVEIHVRRSAAAVIAYTKHAYRDHYYGPSVKKQLYEFFQQFGRLRNVLLRKIIRIFFGVSST